MKMTVWYSEQALAVMNAISDLAGYDHQCNTNRNDCHGGQHRHFGNHSNDVRELAYDSREFSIVVPIASGYHIVCDYNSPADERNQSKDNAASSNIAEHPWICKQLIFQLMSYCPVTSLGLHRRQSLTRRPFAGGRSPNHRGRHHLQGEGHHPGPGQGSGPSPRARVPALEAAPLPRRRRPAGGDDATAGLQGQDGRAGLARPARIGRRSLWTLQRDWASTSGGWCSAAPPYRRWCP